MMDFGDDGHLTDRDLCWDLHGKCRAIEGTRLVHLYLWTSIMLHSKLLNVKARVHALHGTRD